MRFRRRRWWGLRFRADRGRGRGGWRGRCRRGRVRRLIGAFAGELGRRAASAPGSERLRDRDEIDGHGLLLGSAVRVACGPGAARFRPLDELVQRERSPIAAVIVVLVEVENTFARACKRAAPGREGE